MAFNLEIVLCLEIVSAKLTCVKRRSHLFMGAVFFREPRLLLGRYLDTRVDTVLDTYLGHHECFCNPN